MLDRAKIESVVDAVCAGNLQAIEQLISWPAADVTLRIDPSVAALTEEPMPFLRQYWDQLPRGQRLPLMAAVDPVAMAPALGLLALIDIIDDGWNGRYRVFGSSVTGSLGAELTGKTMETGLPTRALPLHVGFLRIMLRMAVPLYTRHVSSPEIAVVDWRRLMLPLEGPDGAISRVLIASIPGPWRPPVVQR
jgi:hypothetical protein